MRLIEIWRLTLTAFSWVGILLLSLAILIQGYVFAFIYLEPSKDRLYRDCPIVQIRSLKIGMSRNAVVAVLGEPAEIKLNFQRVRTAPHMYMQLYDEPKIASLVYGRISIIPSRLQATTVLKFDVNSNLTEVKTRLDASLAPMNQIVYFLDGSRRIDYLDDSISMKAKYP